MHSHYEEHFDKLRELIMIEIYWNPDRKITKQEFDNEPSWVVETKWKNLNNQLVNTCLLSIDRLNYYWFLSVRM